MSKYNTDFSIGLSLINSGGTHEENPYEGVLVGSDQIGNPNLVEEGEVIFKGYVFSNRLSAEDSLLDKVKLHSKYKGKTFAKIAEDLSKEALERPNDPISKKGLEASMAKLMSAQELYKLENGMDNMITQLMEQMLQLAELLAMEEELSMEDLGMGGEEMELGYEEGMSDPMELMPEEGMELPLMFAFGGNINQPNMFAKGGPKNDYTKYRKPRRDYSYTQKELDGSISHKGRPSFFSRSLSENSLDNDGYVYIESLLKEVPIELIVKDKYRLKYANQLTNSELARIDSQIRKMDEDKKLFERESKKVVEKPKTEVPKLERKVAEIPPKKVEKYLALKNVSTNPNVPKEALVPGYNSSKSPTRGFYSKSLDKFYSKELMKKIPASELELMSLGDKTDFSISKMGWDSDPYDNDGNLLPDLLNKSISKLTPEHRELLRKEGRIDKLPGIGTERIVPDKSVGIQKRSELEKEAIERRRERNSKKGRRVQPLPEVKKETKPDSVFQSNSSKLEFPLPKAVQVKDSIPNKGQVLNAKDSTLVADNGGIPIMDGRIVNGNGLKNVEDKKRTSQNNGQYRGDSRFFPNESSFPGMTGMFKRDNLPVLENDLNPYPSKGNPWGKKNNYNLRQGELPEVNIDRTRTYIPKEKTPTYKLVDSRAMQQPLLGLNGMPEYSMSNPNMEKPSNIQLGSPIKASISANSNGKDKGDGKGMDLSLLRYAPIIGSGANMVKDLFGLLNKADYSAVDRILKGIRPISKIGAQTINNRMEYKPIDESYLLQQHLGMNQGNANFVRNNSGGNRATMMALMGALSNLSSNQMGDIHRNATMLNQLLRNQASEFNRLTDMTNMNAINQARQFNVGVQQQQNQLKTNVFAQLAQMRDLIDRGVSSAKSANRDNFYKNMGALGQEQASMNMVNNIPGLAYYLTKGFETLYKENE